MMNAPMDARRTLAIIFEKKTLTALAAVTGIAASVTPSDRIGNHSVMMVMSTLNVTAQATASRHVGC